jgi:hypothetical protein
VSAMSSSRMRDSIGRRIMVRAEQTCVAWYSGCMAVTEAQELRYRVLDSVADTALLNDLLCES